MDLPSCHIAVDFLPDLAVCKESRSCEGSLRSAPRCLLQANAFFGRNSGAGHSDTEVDDVGHLVGNSLEDGLAQVLRSTTEEPTLAKANPSITWASVTNGATA